MSQTYKLRKPFSINGKEFRELVVDLDEISADDLIGVYDEHNVRRSGNPSYSSQNLPLLIVARLNNIVLEDLRSKIKGKDFLALMRIVDDFFTDSDSEATRSPETVGPTPATTPATGQN